MFNNTPTYISLFSSAGVGCYGFKMENFKCIATNELIERRLNVQKNNHKCDFETGYINGDITLDSTKELIFDEIQKWHKLGNDKVDVVIATPPCQGMSVANHKKNITDYNRNSLVVESINIVKTIKPRFFVFENVPAFMKTACEAPDGTPKAIETVINEELSSEYSYASRVINFKNYGSNSSRTRTLVIGVHKSLSDFISPIELYPDYREEPLLKDVLTSMKPLPWGAFDDEDFYHQFRTYDDKMRPWIANTPIGCSAFDNADALHRPHRIVDGVYVPNVRKNGDKYTRQVWDKVAPCIHTRNDQLASQNTIHPVEDRVFSIRELMKMMSIPDSFRWIDQDLNELNALREEEKRKLLKQHEINIRQSIGEAVPTEIFRQVAAKIKKFLSLKNLSDKEIEALIKEKNLTDITNLISFLTAENTYSIGSLSRLIELSNVSREDNEAFFTNKSILNDIYKELPDIDKNEINILEPSVGIGNFLPFLFKRYESKKTINIDVVDIDANIICLLKELLKKYDLPKNVNISFINADTLLHSFDKKYDLVIGNPPFANAKGTLLKTYQAELHNKDTKNLASFFMEKAIKVADYVVMITPKNFLNTPEFELTRNLLNQYKIDCILDFGEKGFKKVLIETICFMINTNAKPNKTKVISITNKTVQEQKQSYITDSKLPYWVIYRDDKFDVIFDSMEFDIFDVFRDRQITNNNTKSVKTGDDVRVLKSRNISDTGEEVIDIDNYDAYIEQTVLSGLSVNKYTNADNIYLTPNMTYNPRVCLKPKGITVNGSIAILIPKDNRVLSKEDMLYFSSNEYREFYRIARNYQTRSLNVDKTSVFFFGVKKG